MQEEIKKQPPLLKLKQFELFVISKFLTFPELTTFFQLAIKFNQIKKITHDDLKSNLARLMSISDGEVIKVLRRALSLKLLSSAELLYAQILLNSTKRLYSKLNLPQQKGGRPRRIIKEIISSFDKLSETIVCCVEIETYQEYRFMMKGASDSVYKEGYFVVEVKYPHDYPFKPFAISFLTPFYHPSINIAGQICNCCYKEDWRPSITIIHYLQDILEAMRDPTKILQKYACTLRLDLQKDIENNYARFQKMAILNTQENAKFSLDPLLREKAGEKK